LRELIFVTFEELEKEGSLGKTVWCIRFQRKRGGAGPVVSAAKGSGDWENCWMRRRHPVLAVGVKEFSGVSSSSSRRGLRGTNLYKGGRRVQGNRKVKTLRQKAIRVSGKWEKVRGTNERGFERVSSGHSFSLRSRP